MKQTQQESTRDEPRVSEGRASVKPGGRWRPHSPPQHRDRLSRGDTGGRALPCASTRHAGPEQTARRAQMCVSSAVAGFIPANPSCSPGSHPGAGGEPLALIRGAFPQASRCRQERQAGPAAPGGRALERERRAGERGGQDTLGCAAQVRPGPGPGPLRSRRHLGGLAPPGPPLTQPHCAFMFQPQQPPRL